MAHILKMNEYGRSNIVNEGLTPRSLTIRFNKAFRMFKESLINGDSDIFVMSIEAFYKFFEDLYGTKRDNDKCEYKIKTFFWTRAYEFNNDKREYKYCGYNSEYSTSPIRNFNSYTTQKWDFYDEKNHRVPEISFRFKWGDNNGHTISVDTSVNCYREQQNSQNVFFKRIETNFLDYMKSEISRAEAERTFSDATLKKYNMIGVRNYVDWVADNAITILKSNGLYDTHSFYSGISLRDSGCSFWTGALKGLTANGITYYVGGDSTDQEDIISYSEWKSRRGYRQYLDIAECYCDIDYDKKTKFSKKIYDYILELLKKGKLK